MWLFIYAKFVENRTVFGRKNENLDGNILAKSHAQGMLLGVDFSIHNLAPKLIYTALNLSVITPPQNWSKYKKVVFKQDMVYMNLEGNWSLATPLTGLGCARSYYENFSAKFMNFFIPTTPPQNWLKLKYKKVVFKQDMVYMNLEGNWSLATPLTGLSCACSYYEIFLAMFRNSLKNRLLGIPF